MPALVQKAAQVSFSTHLYSCGPLDELDEYTLVVMACLVEMRDRDEALNPVETDLVEVYFETEMEPLSAAHEIHRRRIARS